jgi:hypothetical protein
MHRRRWSCHLSTGCPSPAFHDSGESPNPYPSSPIHWGGAGLESHAPQIGAACAIILVPKIVERWLLFKYVGREFTPLSKPLKSKEQLEKTRLKYSERERKAIGIGVIRTEG